MRGSGIILGVALAAMLLVGCGNGDQAHGGAKAGGATDADQASQTLQQMLEVAERGDWGAYVDRFYGEKVKLTAQPMRDALVLRFERDWGEKVVPVLRRAAELTPRIDGDTAVFEDDEGPVFILHRSPSGAWGFHL